MSSFVARVGGSILTGAFALAVAAPAADVFVGGPAGQIYRGDSQLGDFESFGLCGGSIDSMAVYDNQLYAGTVDGTVYRIDLLTHQIVSSFTVSNDATAVAVHGQELLISGTDGTIIRVDPETGAELGTFQTHIPMGIEAMTVRGDYAYIGGDEGSVWRVNLLNGTDTYFACVCFTRVQALDTDDTHLILAEEAGLISRIRLTTGQIDQVYFVSPAPRAVKVYGQELLVSDNSGDLVRVNSQNGQVINSFSAPIEVDAMAGLPEPQCPADLSGNGEVNLVDLSIILSNFGTVDGMRHEDGDIDGDGDVDLADLSALLTDYGTSCN
ncbi:MAG: PQQ-binding-like beta-propeller repeat protein [Phycisphaerae bacterium]|jgi:outer membrane protein assembly factor BamB